MSHSSPSIVVSQQLLQNYCFADKRSDNSCQDAVFAKELPFNADVAANYKPTLALFISAIQAAAAYFPPGGCTLSGAVVVASAGRVSGCSFNCGDSKTLVMNQAEILHETIFHTPGIDPGFPGKNFILHVTLSGKKSEEAFLATVEACGETSFEWQRFQISPPNCIVIGLKFRPELAISAINAKLLALLKSIDTELMPVFRVSSLAMTRAIGDTGIKGLYREPDLVAFGPFDFPSDGTSLSVVAASDGLYDVVELSEILKSKQDQCLADLGGKAREKWRAEWTSSDDIGISVLDIFPCASDACYVMGVADGHNTHGQLYAALCRSVFTHVLPAYLTPGSSSLTTALMQVRRDLLQLARQDFPSDPKILGNINQAVDSLQIWLGIELIPPSPAAFLVLSEGGGAAGAGGPAYSP